MPSSATTIFKIQATQDFLSETESLLSFRKGQPFYALAVDYEKQIYFVSTQFSVPFSPRAVSGIVPMEYFQRVDLRKPAAVKTTVKTAVKRRAVKQVQVSVPEEKPVPAVPQPRQVHPRKQSLFDFKRRDSGADVEVDETLSKKFKSLFSNIL